MEREIFISVIVPVYNGEAFLHRAVDSVLCQMDGRIELILVNDGSTDASGRICDEYAEKNPNIRVIHKKNGGTSSAKNMAINVARGQYLSFMDCDDRFDEDAFSQIIPVLKEHQPDCLDFGWRYVDVQGRTTENLHQCTKNTLLSQDELEKVILPPLLNLCKDDDHFVYDFCCTKIFKSEIIQKFQVRFDEDKRTWEDRTFLLRHLRHCQNYYAMDRCFYNYIFTPNSLSQRYCLDYFRIILANFRHYRELFCDRFDFDTQYVNDYWASAIENMIFQSLDQKENRKIIHGRILEALRNEQVIHWLTKRTPAQPFQKELQKLLLSGEYEKALRCLRRNKPKKRSALWLSRVKRIIKKVTGMR